MSHVVIVTKPLHALAALPFLKARHPGRRIVGVLDGAASLLTFRYPRGLALSDYPFVSEPRWKPDPQRMSGQIVYEITDGHRVPLDADPFETLREAERIVCAEGDWWGGAANFDILMRHAGGDALAERAHDFLRQSTLRPEALRRQVEAMGTTHDADFAAHRDGGLVKRRFDWCFAVNSQALLGDAHRRATGSREAPVIGKYALQLLYAMRTLDPMTDAELMGTLAHWKGTGRYADRAGPRVAMGSAMSWSRIVEDVTSSGLTETTPAVRGARRTTAFSLNEAGRRFLDLLHPDCRDPDLPWRIQAWMEEGAASTAKADRYVRTYFGRQGRFASRAR